MEIAPLRTPLPKWEWGLEFTYSGTKYMYIQIWISTG